MLNTLLISSLEVKAAEWSWISNIYRTYSKGPRTLPWRIPNFIGDDVIWLVIILNEEVMNYRDTILKRWSNVEVGISLFPKQSSTPDLIKKLANGQERCDTDFSPSKSINYVTDSITLSNWGFGTIWLFAIMGSKFWDLYKFCDNWE